MPPWKARSPAGCCPRQ